jgi:hypothetical protein
MRQRDSKCLVTRDLDQPCILRDAGEGQPFETKQMNHILRRKRFSSRNLRRRAEKHKCFLRIRHDLGLVKPSDTGRKSSAPNHDIEIGDFVYTSALVGTSPGKAMAGEIGPINTASPSPIVSRISPSSTARTRSILANAEKGPELGTLAMLMRQSKSLIAAPDGEIAISVVNPPPFFHGIRR